MSRMISLCLIGGVLAATGVWASPKDQKDQAPKKHAGKTLMEWYDLLKKGKTVKTRQVAVLVLAGIDEETKHAEPTILPTLLDTLTQDTSPEVRATAAEVLGTLGPQQKESNALKVAKALIDTLANKGEAAGVRQAAAKALGGKMVEYAPDAITALADALSDADQATRTAAAVTLKDYGKEALQALPKLLAAVKDSKLDQYTRVYTLQIVTKYVEDAGTLVPLLTDLLKEKDAPAGLKLAAVNGLGPHARDAAAATDPLLDILKDDSAPVLLRQSAATVLAKIQPDSAKVWPTLKTLMKEGNATIRAQAIRLAAKLCRAEKDLVPALIERCDDDYADAQIAAVQELGDLGDAAKPALATLQRLAETSARPTVRDAAAAALKKLQS